MLASLFRKVGPFGLVTWLALLSAPAISPLAVARAQTGTPIAASPPIQYQMDVSLDTVASTIGGSLDVEFTNFTPEIQNALFFRLYPNAAYYAQGGSEI